MSCSLWQMRILLLRMIQFVLVSLKTIQENIELAKSHDVVGYSGRSNRYHCSKLGQYLYHGYPWASIPLSGSNPQTFKMKTFLPCIMTWWSAKEVLTDACKIFVINGKKSCSCKGEYSNIKITTITDLKIARVWLRTINMLNQIFQLTQPKNITIKYQEGRHEPWRQGVNTPYYMAVVMRTNVISEKRDPHKKRSTRGPWSMRSSGIVVAGSYGTYQPGQVAWFQSTSSSNRGVFFENYLEGRASCLGSFNGFMQEVVALPLDR